MFRIIVFDSKQLFMRGRWVLSLALMALLTFFEINRVSAYSANTRLGVGIWDVLFSVFGALWEIIMVVTPLVIYLCSDIVGDHGYGPTLFLRASTRSQWWFCKVAILAMTVIGFTTGAVMVATLLAVVFMPINGGWSQAALKAPTMFYLNPGTLSMPPYAAFILLLVLLMLGWLTLGLLSMVVAYKTNRIYGFTAAILIDLFAFAVWKMGVGSPASYALVTNHLLFSLHALGNNKRFAMPISASLAFWLILIAVFLATTYRQSLAKDYY